MMCAAVHVMRTSTGPRPCVCAARYSPLLAAMHEVTLKTHLDRLQVCASAQARMINPSKATRPNNCDHLPQPIV